MIAEIPSHVAWALWITAGATLGDVVIRVMGHRSRVALTKAQTGEASARAEEASTKAEVNVATAEVLRQGGIGFDVAAEVRQTTQSPR